MDKSDEDEEYTHKLFARLNKRVTITTCSYRCSRTLLKAGLCHLVDHFTHNLFIRLLLRPNHDSLSLFRGQFTNRVHDDICIVECIDVLTFFKLILLEYDVLLC